MRANKLIFYFSHLKITHSRAHKHTQITVGRIHVNCREQRPERNCPDLYWRRRFVLARRAAQCGRIVIA